MDTARVNPVAFWGDYSSRLDVAEPFRDNTTFRAPNQVSPVLSYQWGFTDGGGLPDAIYNDQGTLKYTSQMLSANAESPVAFWTLEGSYFADFNLPDNFARSIIAKPNYGLLVFPVSSQPGPPVWVLDEMARGETAGKTFVTSVNLADERYRWLNLIGDPTLRLNTVTPPTSVSATRPSATVKVTWVPASGVNRYFVYRAGSDQGPFEQIGTAVTQAPWEMQNITYDVNKRIYMVRGAQITSTGRGSYWNLSQGAFATVP